MAARKKRPPSKADQPALPGTKKRHTPGTVERAAIADVKALEDRTPEGSTAIAWAYKSMARDVDRAERDNDGWKKATYVRELLKLRAALGPLTAAPADGSSLDEFVAGLPVAPVGDDPQPEPTGDVRDDGRPVASVDPPVADAPASTPHR